jgi:hypothetical protein
MKCFRNSIFTAAALAVLATASLPAQEIKRLSNGKPDLNGVWDHPRVGDMTKSSTECASGSTGCKQEGMADLPYAAWGLEQWKKPVHFDYTARCLPWGYSRTLGTEYPVEFVQTPQRLAILFESNNVFHVIPTDGRDHPKNLDSAWFGNSVGKYDGDTLVIDSIGFNDSTYLDTAEHPHSDQLHLVERYTPVDANHLNYEVTIDDKKAYEKPWKNTRTFVRMKPGSELMEFVCMENNKDLFEGHIPLQARPYGGR